MISKYTRRPLAPLALLPLLVAVPASAQLLPRAEILPQPSVPTTAAPLSFEEIFAGVNPAPLRLKITDLKGEWRVVTVRTSNGVSENTSENSFASTPMQPRFIMRLRESMGAAPTQLITQGQTVAGGGELFLVSYRMNFNEAELQRTMESIDKGRAQNPSPQEVSALLEAYARERPLELSLINVKLLSELSGVRAFNAEAQSAAIRDLVQAMFVESGADRTPVNAAPAATATIEKPPVAPAPKPPVSNGTSRPPVVVTPLPPATIKPAVSPKPTTAAPANAAPKSDTSGLAARNEASLSNLRRVGGALLAYAKEHGGLLPPMGTPAQAKAALLSLAGNVPIWSRSDTNEAYRPNPILSGRKTAHISNPDEFVAFYEVNPAPDGTHGVLFLNGIARRLTQAEWAHAKKASKLR